MNIKDWKFEITLATAIWAMLWAFNLGGEVTSLHSRIEALENSQVPIERFVKMETKIDYMWEDIGEIKEVIKSTLAFNK